MGAWQVAGRGGQWGRASGWAAVGAWQVAGRGLVTGRKRDKRRVGWVAGRATKPRFIWG